MQRIGIIGAGAWGTALAATIRRAGREVTLWAHEPAVAEAIRKDGVNAAYLPGLTLPPGIEATNDLARACDADAVLLVTPAQFLRPIAKQARATWWDGTPAVICAKGIEIGSGALMTDVVAEEIPSATQAVLSGPTFAAEVVKGLPTAVTLACADAELGQALAEALATPTFRIYWADDLVGAEVGGAVKNVLAIACGIVEGKGMGDNARAALITRGLAEISRLTLALGGKPETLAGLAGIGDITLTCNAMQSRNFSLGVALGQGRTLAEVMGERNSVAEGVHTAKSVGALAGKLAVEMPICDAVHAILHQGAAVETVVQGLLARPQRAESPLG